MESFVFLSQHFCLVSPLFKILQVLMVLARVQLPSGLYDACYNLLSSLSHDTPSCPFSTLVHTAPPYDLAPPSFFLLLIIVNCFPYWCFVEDFVFPMFCFLLFTKKMFKSHWPVKQCLPNKVSHFARFK